MLEHLNKLCFINKKFEKMGLLYLSVIVKNVCLTILRRVGPKNKSNVSIHDAPTLIFIQAKIPFALRFEPAISCDFQTHIYFLFFSEGKK